MINYRYKVIAPTIIEKIPYLENILNKDLIVRPKYLSICAADQRYYFGWRDESILLKKYPLSLIHEAVGEVVYDKTNSFSVGDNVVLFPLVMKGKTCSNYLKENLFMSSDIDGFMQEFVFTNKENVLKINSKDVLKNVLCELTSVAFHAIKSVRNVIKESDIIGIWGDGSLGFIIHICLKYLFPKNKIMVYGKHNDKLNLFNTYATKINITQKNKYKNVDIAFECVGGESSEKVIENVLNYINPLGKIILLGVSENEIKVDTRKILEKGLLLIGRSRSNIADFKDALKFLETNQSTDLNRIISKVVDVKSIKDIKNSFDLSLTESHKVIMEWNI